MFSECFICARHHAKHFTKDILFKVYHDNMKHVLLLPQFIPKGSQDISFLQDHQ